MNSLSEYPRREKPYTLVCAEITGKGFQFTDALTHHAEQFRLKFRHMPRHAGHGVEGQSADRAGIQRNNVCNVFARVNGIEADDFTRQVKAKNLFLSFVVDYVAFETARSDGGNRPEFVPSPE